MASNASIPLKKLALSAMLVAAGVPLSVFLRIPGMCPMQHFINIVGAVLLGPWYALLVAGVMSVLRMSLLGINILALTGSVFGAVCSGLLYRRTRSLLAAWLGEVLGTGVLGALASYPALILFAGPAAAVPSWYYYIPWFTAGTLIGGAVAFVFLLALRRNGLLERMQQGLAGFAAKASTLPCVLSIAGSDCSGGAGIQADIKAVSANGCYAMTVITAVTAQNTTGVRGVEDIAPDMIAGQMDAVFEDIPPAAVKIGMLSRPETIRTVADKLRDCPAPIVLDPVMVSTSGSRLLAREAVELLKERLIPLAHLITPNLPEAEELSGITIESDEDRERAARILHQMGCRYVLIKGGHAGERATDLLFDGERFHRFDGQRIRTKNTHGTGCTLSSAIAANLAQGMPCEQAVGEAKRYIHTAIAHSLELGAGCGPTHPFYTLYQKAGV